MKKRKLISYIIATYFVSWVLWIPLVLVSQGFLVGALPEQMLLRAGSFGPSGVAFAFVYREHGWQGVKRLLFRGIKMPITLSSLSYVFLLIPGLACGSFLLASLYSNLSLQLGIPLKYIIPAFFLILFLMGPLGEEFGWRGFALEPLIEEVSPLKASLLLGFVWSAWHLPLFFVEGTTQQQMAAQKLVLVLLGYLFYTTLLTILMTYLHYKTGGSVLAAILFHTISNLTQGVIPLLASIEAISTFLGGLFLFTVVLVYTRKRFFLQKQMF